MLKYPRIPRTAPLPRLEEARVAVIGLGYVGLPLAAALARHRPTVGFDISDSRIGELGNGYDRTREVDPAALTATHLTFTTQPADIAGANVYLVTVPTPVDAYKQPDLTALLEASATVGGAVGLGDVVVFESTVYPGATEEECVPVIEEVSGLRLNEDFFVGYSPERANPGDGPIRSRRSSRSWPVRRRK